MHWLLIGLAVALGVCAVAAFELLRRLRRRTSRDVETQVSATVQTLESRLDELAQELSSAVRKAEEETQRSRFLAQIGSTIDLDEAIRATLGAAASLPRVDAALVELDATDEEERVVQAVGVEGEELGPAFVGPPDRRDARAVELEYLYEADNAAGAMHGALGVPLAHRDTRIGWLGVFSRVAGTHFGDDDLQRLEELAERVAPAIENARRFREARQLADLDALTGLHNRRYFHETLAREVGRAHRYDRQFALVLFDLDDFKAINDRIGHLAGDSVLAEVAARMMSVVRSADVACRVGGDEFGIVLPESVGTDAELLATRISHSISAKPIGKAGTLFLSAGVAELRPGDGGVELFERADAALYRAKELGKARTVTADFPNGAA